MTKQLTFVVRVGNLFVADAADGSAWGLVPRRGDAFMFDSASEATAAYMRVMNHLLGGGVEALGETRA